jgi:1-deoxy-D-xylulose-5-phosphate synthase
MPLPSKYSQYQELCKMPVEDLISVAAELRNFLINTILENGGHFAANLGIIELTVALLSEIDPKFSPVIWDVGHQSYPYKVLTGRGDEIKNIRNKNGISGFPKRSESPFDWFGTGHSSTALSAALGFAEALKYNQTRPPVFAIIGDGALTGGMAYEAMNNMIDLNYPLVVILNDNQMGIDPNTGALNKHLVHLQKDKQPQQVREFFEWFGFIYQGPFDGHDIGVLKKTLKEAISQNKPHLIHIQTVKGKGYEPAEKEQTRWHSATKYIKVDHPSPKDQETKTNDQRPKTNDQRPKTYDQGLKTKDQSPMAKWQDIFGETLLELANNNQELRGVTPAMPSSCGMLPTLEKYPDRFFDVGISEQHAVTFAAGIAAGGKKVVVNIYSTFLQRAYDQIIHDVVLQNLPVVFCIDRAGLVGEDGPTHHGSYDLSFLLPLPNITILAPYQSSELRSMMHWALEQNHPVFIRYPRGETPIQAQNKILANPTEPKIIHQSSNPKILISTTGIATQLAITALEKKPELFNHVDLIHFPAVKHATEVPFIQKKNYQHGITIEDGSIIGGFGQYFKYLWEKWDNSPSNQLNPRFHHLGIQDHFPAHGSIAELQEDEGFDVDSILTKLNQLLINS